MCICYGEHTYLRCTHATHNYINSKINSDSNSDCPPTSRSTYGGDEKQWIVLEWSKYTDTHTTPATSELVAAIAWPVQIHSAMPPIQANLSTYHDSSLLIVWGHWDLIAYSSPTYTHAIINNYDWLVHVKKKKKKKTYIIHKEQVKASSVWTILGPAHFMFFLHVSTLPCF